jgi:hypothetical protein
LEKRIGRRMRPKDFPADNGLNQLPGTPRLLNRRDGDYKGSFILRRGPHTIEAFANSDKSLGTFATEREAAEAVDGAGHEARADVAAHFSLLMLIARSYSLSVQRCLPVGSCLQYQDAPTRSKSSPNGHATLFPLSHDYQR